MGLNLGALPWLLPRAAACLARLPGGVWVWLPMAMAVVPDQCVLGHGHL